MSKLPVLACSEMGPAARHEKEGSETMMPKERVVPCLSELRIVKCLAELVSIKAYLEALDGPARDFHTSEKKQRLIFENKEMFILFVDITIRVLSWALDF
jgi:hypothetical protein